MPSNIRSFVRASALAIIWIGAGLSPASFAEYSGDSRPDATRDGTDGVATASEMSSADDLPEGLSSEDWRSIRHAWQAAQYAVRPVASDPKFSQQGYLKASNTGSFDLLGFSVSVDGDTLVVGARSEDSSATGVDGEQADNSAGASGAAYVFIRDGTGTWSQQAYLKASNTDASDHFGVSVSVDGDTIVVGANQEASSATGVDGNQADNSMERSGAAYVFTRDDAGIWSQQAYLKASNSDAFDEFGRTVGVDGDTVVVGAPWEQSSATGVDGDQADNSANLAGAAYVFTRDGTGAWSQQAYLKASNTDSADIFGWSVGVDGGTVVIGARRESGAGAAYIFTRDGTGTWSQQGYLKASESERGDGLGWSVSLDDDTVVLGATGEDSGATGVDGDQGDDSASSSGAAYVFTRDGTGTWSQQAYLKASNTEAGDEFGYAVGVDGDTVVVGTPVEQSSATGVDGDQADNSANLAGAAYVFIRDGTGSWSHQAYLKASNTDSDDLFGWSVGVDGGTVVIGALGESGGATGVDVNQADNSASCAGAAYVFFLAGIFSDGFESGTTDAWTTAVP